MIVTGWCYKCGEFTLKDVTPEKDTDKFIYTCLKCGHQKVWKISSDNFHNCCDSVRCETK